jgi:hypothetical protein
LDSPEVLAPVRLFFKAVVVAGLLLLVALALAALVVMVERVRHRLSQALLLPVLAAAVVVLILAKHRERVALVAAVQEA